MSPCNDLMLTNVALNCMGFFCRIVACSFVIVHAGPIVCVCVYVEVAVR